MIALSSVLAGYESIRRLIDPRPLTHVGVVIAAGIIGFAGNELVALYRIRIGRTIGSAALVADGLHARTDGFTSQAVVIGALGVLAGFPVADPIIGILITIAILFVLRGAVTGVRGIESLRLRWVGHRMRAEVALLVDPALTVVDGHEIAVTAHHQLLHDVPRLVDATVHVSPAGHHGDQQHQVLAHHQR